MRDMDYMKLAVEEAKKAEALDEVPVGAVLVYEGEVIARAHNMVLQTSDATAHAELTVLREGMKKLGWRLCGCTLYVTLEPCAMCVGAMLNARLSKLVFGAYEERTGCCGSLVDLTQGTLHTIMSIGGMYEEECAALMTDYFAAKREKNILKG